MSIPPSNQPHRFKLYIAGYERVNDSRHLALYIESRNVLNLVIELTGSPDNQICQFSNKDPRGEQGFVGLIYIHDLQDVRSIELIKETALATAATGGWECRNSGYFVVAILGRLDRSGFFGFDLFEMWDETFIWRGIMRGLSGR